VLRQSGGIYRSRMTEFTADSYVTVLARETRRRFACAARDADELARWQLSFRPALRELLGIPRIAERGISALESRRVGEVEADDHVREEWTIRSEPGFELPFFLLRPRRLDRPAPLVLTPHGHIRQAKAAYAGLWSSEEERVALIEGERDIALQAVRAGYVAIAPDMRGFAGLRRREDIAADSHKSCRALQLLAQLFGRTLIGERVWDIGRLIDYAVTRPDIDAGRIAITGNSGGGTVSLFAAACDERISLCIPGCAFCTIEDSIGSIRHCECNYVPGIMTHAEMSDVACLVWPRPFLVVAGRQDEIFPIAAVERAFAQVEGIYRAAGTPERCRLSIGEGGHRYYKRDVWPFVAEFMGASSL
jgi:dienelactone hydrolase